MKDRTEKDRSGHKKDKIPENSPKRNAPSSEF